MCNQPQPVFKYNNSVIHHLIISNWIMLNIKDLSDNSPKKWNNWLKLKKTQKKLESYSECLKKDGLKPFLTDENKDEYCNIMIATSYTMWSNLDLHFDIYSFHELTIKHKLFIQHKKDTATKVAERCSFDPCFAQMLFLIQQDLENEDLHPVDFWLKISYILENSGEHLTTSVQLCLDYLFFNELSDLTEESTPKDIRLHRLLTFLSRFSIPGLYIDLEKCFRWLTPVCPELVKTCKHLYRIR